MRTSVEIPDALIDRARRVMAQRGVTLRSLIEEGLRRALDEAQLTPEFELQDARFRGRAGFAPGASDADITDAIRRFNESRDSE